MNVRIFRNVFFVLALIISLAAFAYSLLGEGKAGCSSCGGSSQCPTYPPAMEAE